MDTLLTSSTEALYGNFSLAVAASFAWGVMSIVLSPCHLSSIPLIIGFLTAQDETKRQRGILLSFVFASGILLTIALIGLVTGLAGRILGDVGPYGRYAAAGVFFLVGLYLMDLIPLPQGGFRLPPIKFPSEYTSAIVLGLVFGVALGPCTFAFLAPVLGVVFQIFATNALGAGALLLAFGLGHCVVIVAAGGLAVKVQTYLDWSNRSRVIPWVRRTAGLLVMLGGVHSVLST